MSATNKINDYFQSIPVDKIIQSVRELQEMRKTGVMPDGAARAIAHDIQKLIGLTYSDALNVARDGVTWRFIDIQMGKIEHNKGDKSIVVRMTLTIEQAMSVADATDVYGRLTMGQVSMVSEMVADGRIPFATSVEPTNTEYDIIRHQVGAIAATLRYNGLGHSLGIGNRRVPMNGHRAWEVKKILEQALAMNRNPNPISRGVDYDGLTVRYTQDPLPVVELISNYQNN